jgi:hypothetical protein
MIKYGIAACSEMPFVSDFRLELALRVQQRNALVCLSQEAQHSKAFVCELKTIQI